MIRLHCIPDISLQVRDIQKSVTAKWGAMCSRIKWVFLGSFISVGFSLACGVWCKQLHCVSLGILKSQLAESVLFFFSLTASIPLIILKISEMPIILNRRWNRSGLTVSRKLNPSQLSRAIRKQHRCCRDSKLLCPVSSQQNFCLAENPGAAHPVREEEGSISSRLRVGVLSAVHPRGPAVPLPCVRMMVWCPFDSWGFRWLCLPLW